MWYGQWWWVWVLESTKSGSASWFYQLLIVWHWVNYSTSRSPNFLLSKWKLKICFGELVENFSEMLRLRQSVQWLPHRCSVQGQSLLIQYSSQHWDPPKHHLSTVLSKGLAVSNMIACLPLPPEMVQNRKNQWVKSKNVDILALWFFSTPKELNKQYL